MSCRYNIVSYYLDLACVYSGIYYSKSMYLCLKESGYLDNSIYDAVDFNYSLGGYFILNL